ncbi:MAG TPA: IPT/TIG domain-containing protein, partial [Solirubrobacteraceae bacterium]|nr:IPT/TIG domain-containing protein [Solirubrobacteraceae bacterium]
MTGLAALAGRGRLSARALALAACVSLLLGAGLWLELHAAASGSPAAAPAGVRAALSRLSAAQRASISQALGAEQAAYRFDRVDGAFRAVNPAQGLSVTAGRARATVRSGSLDLTMSLAALGYGGALHAAGPARVSAERNRVAYARGEASEWYVNGPLGLEQGFTVFAPPGRPDGSPLTLALTVSGDARASLVGGDEQLRFAAPGGRALRYGALSVSDARGRVLPSWIALSAGRVLLRVDARGARFPLRVDPQIEGEDAREKLEGGEEGERAGFSVALSADGDTALVGAPAGAEGGRVLVFARFEGEFEQQGAPLAEPTGTGSGTCMEEAGEEPGECGFGRSVAISANGQVVVVGGPLANGKEGSAWVFTRSGSTWQRSAELTSPTPRAGGYFGRSVAMSADGETILVGAPGENHEIGEAWEFTDSGGTWVAAGEPLAPTKSDGEAGRFGRTVALSGNGEVALVGSPRDAAAWVYERGSPDGAWTAAAQLAGAQGSRFASSMALSEDGGTALIGAPEEARGGEAEAQGAAMVFTRAGEWRQAERLTPGESSKAAGKEQFGSGVALSPEGTTALVGDPGAEADHGLAWLYEEGSSGGWGAPVKRLGGLSYATKGLSAGKAAPDDEVGAAHAGWSVAIASDGDTMLVGGIGDDHKRGAAFVFTAAPLVTGIEPAEGPPEGGTTVTIEGQHFNELMHVRFVPLANATGECPAQGSEAQVVSASANAIEVLAPAGSGEVDVIVQTPFGCNPVLPLDEFTYVHGGHGSGKKGTTQSGGAGTASNPETSTSTSGAGTPQPAQQVLAFGPSSPASCVAALIAKRI